jgi:hypothetical protein
MDLILRADFVFSKINLLDKGEFEIITNLDLDPIIGTYEQIYGGVGLDIMMTYRF